MTEAHDIHMSENNWKWTNRRQRAFVVIAREHTTKSKSDGSTAKPPSIGTRLIVPNAW